MTRSFQRGVGAATMLGAIAFGGSEAAAAEDPPSGEPFAVEATAIVPLDAESAISIVGFRGLIMISALEGHELRVISRELGAQGADRPVGFWQDGSTMLLAPPRGDTGGARQMRIEVPPNIAIALDAADGEVSIQSVGGGLDLRGTNVRAVVTGNSGPLSANLVGGSLTVRESRDATVKVRGTATEISGISGDVTVHATGGTIVLRKIDGATDVESNASKVDLDGLTGSIRVRAHQGEVTVTGNKAGGELAMSGTPLHLKDGAGDMTVTSDAPVDFATMAASLHLDMYGGSLRGKGNQGILEVRTRNTEVNVESITDAMRVQGDGLQAKIADVGGELYIETTISDVVVDRVGSVIVRIDRGNVTVQRAAGSVEAVVAGGDVRIIDASGPVTLELDRGDAEVSWASLSGNKDSRLVNKSGSISVRFPASGGCRVEAKTSYGRIDSDLPAVKVTEDLKNAQGPVNGGYGPIVHVVASGDIRLQDAAKAP